MGLLTDLLLLPINGPYHGLRFVLEQIKEQADAELLDERQVQEDLLALGTLLDLGELLEDEYLAVEAELLERLNEIRAYKEALSAGDSVPDDDDDDLDESWREGA